MNRTSTTLMTIAALGLFIVLFSGCYTQLAVREDEGRSDRQAYDNSANQTGDTSYAGANDSGEYYDHSRSSYYDDGYYGARYRAGFSYYYPSYYWPSYAFSVAYADPWSYSAYSYYDPWWCGTPYVSYPVYGYYPPYGHYYGYGYGSHANPYQHRLRTSGSVRAAAPVQATSPTPTGGGYTPTIDRGSFGPAGDPGGTGFSSPGAVRVNPKSVAPAARTGSGSQRGSAVQSSGGRRSVGAGRVGTTSVPPRSPSPRVTRDARPSVRPAEAPSVAPPRGSGKTDSGSARPSGTSGSRGGNSRGSRP